MAISKNKSDVSVVNEPKFWTGLCNMKVVALNPNKAELEELGIKFKNEPEYVSENDNGRAKVRLDFYVRNEENSILTKVSVWLEDEERVSKKGAYLWINNVVQTCFADEADAYQWFDSSTARKAFVGEDTLHEFIKAWANVKPGDECALETMKDIVKGDLTELKQLIDDLKDNEVKILLGVNETENGVYQDTYNKYFGRASSSTFTYWLKKLNDQYGEFKRDWQNSLELKEWKQGTSVEEVSPDNELEDMAVGKDADF